MKMERQSPITAMTRGGKVLSVSEDTAVAGQSLGYAEYYLWDEYLSLIECYAESLQQLEMWLGGFIG